MKIVKERVKKKFKINGEKESINDERKKKVKIVYFSFLIVFLKGLRR